MNDFTNQMEKIEKEPAELQKKRQKLVSDENAL